MLCPGAPTQQTQARAATRVPTQDKTILASLTKGPTTTNTWPQGKHDCWKILMQYKAIECPEGHVIKH